MSGKRLYNNHNHKSRCRAALKSDLPALSGFSFTLIARRLCWGNQPSAKEFRDCPAIHLALDGSQAVDLTLDWAHFSVTAASTARLSHRNWHKKVWIEAMPVACARSSQWCRAAVVLALFVVLAGPIMGCFNMERKLNISFRMIV